MENYYFTYWINNHGKDEFAKLANTVASNTTIPKSIKGKINNDEYLFHYFWVVYCIVTLNYFALDSEQISFVLDLFMKMGISKVFRPSKILEVQKDVIPDIVKYIEKDLFDTYKSE